MATRRKPDYAAQVLQNPIGISDWILGEKSIAPNYISLDGNRLKWSWRKKGSKLAPLIPGNRLTSADVLMTGAMLDALLEEDVRVNEAGGALEVFRRITDSAAVMRFARIYGPLGICKHGLPATHNPRLHIPPSKARNHCRPLGWPEPDADGLWSILNCWEPVEAWYPLVAAAEATLSVAAILRSGNPVADDEIWAPMGALDPSLSSHAQIVGTLSKAELWQQRQLLDLHLQWWVAVGDVRPLFWWPVGKPEPAPIALGTAYPAWGGFAIAMLAVELLAEVMKGRIYSCSGCRRVYVRTERAPAPNKKNWCPRRDCIRERESQKKRRQRGMGGPNG